MIDRRALIRGTGAGLLFGGGLGACLGGPELGRRIASEQGPPSFLVILADDMRSDAFGAAGNRFARTPAIDALASDGVIFAENFVTTSICPTSRATILTGQYARRHGIWDFATALPEKTLVASYPVLLRDAGYHTGFLGKWGLGGPLPAQAFDVWEGFSGQGWYFDPAHERAQHLTGYLADRAEAFLAGAPRDRPFCLSISTKAPHAQDGSAEPFPADPRYAEWFAGVTVPRPPTATEAAFSRLPPFLQTSEGRERWRQRFATDAAYQHSVRQYYRLIAGVDQLVGDLLHRLEADGRLASTWVLFTSDNGFLLGEHGLAGKWWGFEESIRVPLVVRPPDGVCSRGRVPAMTLNTDLLPTLLDLAGVGLPASNQGRSLLPLLARGEVETRDDWFYEHLFVHPGIARTEGVRTRRHKYLEFPDQSEQGRFLYDLEADPFEETNRIGTAEGDRLAGELRERLVALRAAAA